ncbi:PAS domain S-box protein [Chitinispirillales bacterium ANBcel5]|uniref:hybrid sensor histidine kinase/response regulator n=1 Tax=Cellulosispirillum alkaliphilum TaxID=3039283 RepID=UPI002A57665B|nr:PAS domain S-box protein [Chitinispirillales bacterium ANBcel5]
MDETREISCISTSELLNYAREKGVDHELLKDVSVSREILENQFEWITTDTWVKLFKNAAEAFGGGDDIFFRLGKEILQREVNSFLYLFLKIAPLATIIKVVPKYVKKYTNKNIEVRVNLLSEGMAEVSYIPLKKDKYAYEICEFNKGFTVKTLEIKGCRNVELVELECAAKGSAKSCTYQISWKKGKGLLQKINEIVIPGYKEKNEIIRHLEKNHSNLQKQYSENLALKDFYFHIMNNMGEGIVWLNSQGVITFANKAFCSICEYSSEELYTKNIFSLFPEKEAGGLYDYLLHTRCDEKNSYSRQLTLINSRNEKQFVRLNIVWVKSKHRSPGYLCTVKDINDQVKIERRLYMVENRYRSLYENSPAIIIGIDLEGFFIYANRAMVIQSGYSEEELRGMHCKELLGPDSQIDFSELVIKKSVKSEIQEVHFKAKNGDWKAITLNTYPILDDTETIAGIAGIGVDITETRRLNEQLLRTQRMDLLGKMAGGLAHDFNNLLVSIVGYGRMIQDRSSEEKIKNYAAVIGDASEKAASLIRNLLTFSRGEIVKNKEFSVNNTIKEVGLLVLPLLPKAVKVKIDCTNYDCKIYGDSGKIHQCLLNLCLNASDAMGKSGGSITLRSKKLNDARVRIEVEDTGSGISPEHISKIFDPFFSTKEKGKGTGLGLSVVYGIVKSHHGEILVDSKPGEGTIFIINLPLSNIRRHLESSQFLPVAHRRIAPENGEVLVVDNDDLMVGFCREILCSYGYKIVGFTCPKDALNWYSNYHDRIQLVISDIVMNNINGFDLVRKMKQINNVKVLFISGFTPPSIHPHQNENILLKPFTSRALIDAVNAL